MNTRDRILDVSLDLFSVRGYDSVSIRDICKVVGIKESSVYYHFDNKNAILTALINRFTDIADGMMHKLESVLVERFVSFSDSFSVAADCFFEQYLMDDFCNKVMRILSIEQFGNDDIRELYQEWMIDRPLQFQSEVFSIIMRMGIIPHCDAEYLAVKYYSPIYFYANKWLFSGVLTDECKDAFRASAYNHMRMFLLDFGRINDG